ncbi:MAG TPA: ABC transporter permease [Geminicoccaceae bacterium]|nr:ABC transporter permease [Geminicoccaceae bacterium]
MAVARAPLTVDAARERAAQRRRLRRSERLRRWQAALLVAPLLLFLLVSFLLPIAGMLWRSVDNPELRTAMPATAALIRDWNGEGLPDEQVFATFAAELREAYEARTLASVAKRLAYELPGFRSLLMTTGRGLPQQPAGSWRETLIGLEPQWGEPATWVVIQRAAAPLTPLYLLAALDRHQDATGAIVRAPPDEAIYVNIFVRTFWIGFVVTFWCLLLGYPLAYKLASLPLRISNLLLILVLLPFWTSLLVRTAAWVVLLQREGPINGLLQGLAITDQPLQLVYNRFGIYVAMTHILLPFMVLPLYSVMRGIPPQYMRAAASLGARPLRAFVRVYLPQTVPGVGAGCLLVFILAIGYYITPALVGGANDQMVSYFVAFFTQQTINWGMAAALSAVLLAATLILFAVYARLVGLDRLKLS